VAVGAHETLPSVHGVCRTNEARPSAPVFHLPGGDKYEAVSPGRVRIPCERGVVVLDVRQPSRLTIDATRTLKRGDALVLRAQLFDEKGNTLAMGDAPIAWSFTGAIAATSPSPCAADAKDCPPINAGFAKAYDEGEGHVLARFKDLSSRIVVRVSP